MRVGIIRGDLPGPVFVADLEPVSQYNPPTEPRGQDVYISRPTVAEVEGVLANATSGAGAVIEGSNISGSFPITITSSNDDFKVKTSAAASYTTVLIAQAVYANITTFVAAVNAALVGGGLAVTARQGTGSGTRLAIESNAKGVNSYLAIDATAGGSVFNTPAGFGASAIVRTMPTAATYITALNPVGGTLNVSTATINAVGSTTATNALNLIPSTRGTQTALANAIAPQFTETSVAVESFQVGMLASLRSANFNPDTRRSPALVNGAAIAVVADDGSTTFTAPTPTVSSAVLSGGIITITGTGLGNSERDEDTAVKLTGVINKRITQVQIERAGGSVSATSIVIPASLITGATTVTTSVRVRVRSLVSTLVAVS